MTRRARVWNVHLVMALLVWGLVAALLVWRARGGGGPSPSATDLSIVAEIAAALVLTMRAWVEVVRRGRRGRGGRGGR